MKKVQKYDFEGSFSERERERERVVLCGWKVCLNSNKGFSQLKTATRAY